MLGLIAVCVVAGSSARGAEEEKEAKDSNAVQALVENLGELANADAASEEESNKQIWDVVAAADKILAHPDASDRRKDMARSMKVNFLFRGARRDRATFGKPLADFAAQLKKEDPEGQGAALGAAYVLVVEDIENEDSKGDILAKLEGYQKEYPKSPLGAQLFGLHAGQLFARGEMKEAIAACDKGLELYKDQPAAKMLERAREQFEQKAELIGKPMELSGPTLDGTEFNLASLKGKVVLVDFWATWCGPCVGEMPNVQAVYKRLHDQGFEVVGISLDDNEEELRKFVKEREVPWTQVIFPEKEGRGWDNPLARKFNVSGIPATFVIDRDGKLAAMDVRGEKNLEAIVTRLLKASPTPLAN